MDLEMKLDMGAVAMQITQSNPLNGIEVRYLDDMDVLSLCFQNRHQIPHTCDSDHREVIC